jgi:hypothetical protein
MAVAAQKIGAVLVSDEQQKIWTGRLWHCDALVRAGVLPS